MRILLALTILLATKYSKATTVSTSTGDLRGRTAQLENGMIVSEFLGIPFAEPPVGQLRYKHPIPISPWKGVMECTKYSKACFQNPKTAPVPWVINVNDSAEDCLYLNIYKPENNQSSMAIMIWLYGGSNTAGSTFQDVFNASYMAAMYDIIVVTTNFRVNHLGFLFGNLSEAPGNQAMLDQYTAIKWVYDNAAVFGGDKEQITLFGESSGGAAVGAHAISPLTRPLVKRFIMQSTTSLYSPPPDNINGPKKLKIIAQKVGCALTLDAQIDDAMINCLRSISPYTLVDAENSMFPVPSVDFNYVYGNSFMPEKPENLLIQLDPNDKKDVLLGYNQNEGSIFLYFELSDSWHNDQFTVSNETTLRIIHEYFGSSYIELYNTYIKNTTTDVERTLALEYVLGSYVLACSVQEFAENYPAGSVYFYNFNHLANRYSFDWPKWMGVTHFVDVEFVFGMPFRHSDRYDDKDRFVSGNVMKAWTSFAKTGTPILDGGTMSWPKYMKTNRESVVFDANPIQTVVDYLEICPLLRQITHRDFI